MKRIALLTVLCVVFSLALVGPLWAPIGVTCGVQNSYDRQYTGATFAATNGLVSFPMGQAISGQVMDPATLARHGFTGVKKGDEIQATWQGGCYGLAQLVFANMKTEEGSPMKTERDEVFDTT
jgi:hypothetical protein